MVKHSIPLLWSHSGISSSTLDDADGPSFECGSAMMQPARCGKGSLDVVAPIIRTTGLSMPEILKCGRGKTKGP